MANKCFKLSVVLVIWREKERDERFIMKIGESWVIYRREKNEDGCGMWRVR